MGDIYHNDDVTWTSRIVPNHWSFECLFKHFFAYPHQRNIKVRATGICRGIPRWPGPMTRKKLPFHYVVMDAQKRISNARHPVVWVSDNHYTDIIMSTMASQITSLTIVYSTVFSDSDQRKHQSSALLAFVQGIHLDRWIPHTNGQ